MWGYLLCLLACASAWSAEPKRYIVGFKNTIEAPQPIGKTASERLNLSTRSALQNIQLEAVQSIPTLNIVVTETNSPEAIEELKNSPDVEYVEEDAEIEGSLIPNDPAYTYTANLQRIRADQAWNTTVGNRSVIIAVADSGIDFNHIDLKQQIWTNSAEVPGNGQDDDLNGYIDDVHGWDFVKWDSNPQDAHGHGTHVSGIIGAEGNNSIGITGTAWEVTLMPVRVLGSNNKGSISGVANGIVYATQNGARIINMSLGGKTKTEALKNAIEFASSRGVLVICAAMNDSVNSDRHLRYPSGYKLPGVITVAASGSANDNFSWFTNWGPRTVHLSAPGYWVYSTVPTQFVDGQDYAAKAGTSMATPFVTGVGALILSLRPDLSMKDLRNAILNAVERSSKLSLRLATEGHLNAQKAVEQLSEGFQVWPSYFLIAKGSKHAFTAFSAAGGVNWQTSDPQIATIDTDGVLTAHHEGNVEVWSVDATGASNTAQVKVIPYQAPKDPKEEWYMRILGCSGETRKIKRKIEKWQQKKIEEEASLMLNMGLPFMTAFLVRAASRKKRKKTP